MIRARDNMTDASVRGGWRAVWIVIALVTLARIIYLFWLSPYELTGDEAHYWEWSRRPAMSYYTKGPGVAWAIGASTALLGTSQASVRLPAALLGAGAMACVAALGGMLAPGVRRAPLGALLVYLCVPAYQAVALLMTIDGPMIACWLAGALGAALSLRGMMRGRRALGAHALLGAGVGVGFLFKYTILLMAVGVACAWIESRRAISGRWKPGALLALGVALACAAPVIVWNHRQGWPTLSHLLGHVGASGGDVAIDASDPRSWSPVWTLEMIGSQALLVGPALALMILGMRAGAGRDDEAARVRRLMIWCGGPTLVFYLALTLFTRGEGNWPIAAYSTWAALGGVVLARGLSGWARGFWHWTLGYGVVAGVGMLVLPTLARLPGMDRVIPLRRFSGAREAAAEVRRVVREAALEDPMIIADRYQRAGLLAFYLEGRPVVYCAQHILGDRPTSYDDFPDTDLRDPALAGRDAVLVDGSERRWSRGFEFDWIEPVRDDPMRVFVARGYRGVTPTREGE